MSLEECYTSAEVCALLGLKSEAPKQLSKQGLLPSNGERAKNLRYDKVWVDGLVPLVALCPPASQRDSMLFRLYALHREYYGISPDATIHKRRLHYSRIKNICDELVSAGRLWTLEQLTEALGCPARRPVYWASTGRLCALKFGQRYFLTARYAKYVIEVWTHWATVEELASRWDIPNEAIREWIRANQLPAVRFADAMYRVKRSVFKEFLEAHNKQRALTTENDGLTVEEAARRIGCEKRTLIARISDGSVRSVGKRQTRRIPEEEVVRWEKWFKSLNPDFAWLEAVVVRPDRKVLTLNSKLTKRELSISPMTLTLWSKAGLLPFFPASFSVHGQVARLFVRRYIMGLRSYANGEKVTRATAVAYKTLCREKGYIV